MAREYYLDDAWKPSLASVRCYRVPDGTLLVTNSKKPASLLVLDHNAGKAARECVLPVELHGSLHVYDDRLVTFAYGDLEEEVWFLFNIRENAVVKVLHHKPRPPFRDRLFLGDRWLVAGRGAGYIFHFFSVEGHRLSSLVAPEVADVAPVDGVAGSNALGGYDGELCALDERTFVYVFTFRPLAIAFRDTGQVVWSAFIPGLPTKSEVEDYHRSRGIGSDEMIATSVPLNYYVAVGPAVAILHKSGGQRVSIWSRTGEPLAVREVESNAVGLWWEESSLVVARIEEDRLIIEEKVVQLGSH